MVRRMMVAYHTAAVQHNLDECQPVGKLAENFHVLHKDAALEHDYHTLVHRIHAHSSAEEELTGNKELDVHNLDPVAAHNCNLPVMEVHPLRGQRKGQEHVQKWE